MDAEILRKLRMTVSAKEGPFFPAVNSSNGPLAICVHPREQNPSPLHRGDE